MLQYVVSQSDKDNFIITIMEGDYKGVAVKIVNLQMEETGELDFEIELPSNKTELFKDKTFEDEISMIVGDVVKKSINAIYDTQDELIKIEETVGKIINDKNVRRDESKLLIETFMEKGYLLKINKEEDGDKFVAIDIHTNETFNLENDDDFEKIRQKVFPNIVLN